MPASKSFFEYNKWSATTISQQYSILHLFIFIHGKNTYTQDGKLLAAPPLPAPVYTLRMAQTHIYGAQRKKFLIKLVGVYH